MLAIPAHPQAPLFLYNRPLPVSPEVFPAPFVLSPGHQQQPVGAGQAYFHEILSQGTPAMEGSLTPLLVQCCTIASAMS